MRTHKSSTTNSDAMARQGVSVSMMFAPAEFGAGSSIGMPAMSVSGKGAAWGQGDADVCEDGIVWTRRRRLPKKG